MAFMGEFMCAAWRKITRIYTVRNTRLAAKARGSIGKHTTASKPLLHQMPIGLRSHQMIRHDYFRTCATLREITARILCCGIALQCRQIELVPVTHRYPPNAITRSAIRCPAPRMASHIAVAAVTAAKNHGAEWRARPNSLNARFPADNQ